MHCLPLPHPTADAEEEDQLLFDARTALLRLRALLLLSPGAAGLAGREGEPYDSLSRLVEVGGGQGRVGGGQRGMVLESRPGADLPFSLPCLP